MNKLESKSSIKMKKPSDGRAKCQSERNQVVGEAENAVLPAKKQLIYIIVEKGVIRSDLRLFVLFIGQSIP